MGSAGLTSAVGHSSRQAARPSVFPSFRASGGFPAPRLGAGTLLGTRSRVAYVPFRACGVRGPGGSAQRPEVSEQPESLQRVCKRGGREGGRAARRWGGGVVADPVDVVGVEAAGEAEGGGEGPCGESGAEAGAGSEGAVHLWVRAEVPLRVRPPTLPLIGTTGGWWCGGFGSWQRPRRGRAARGGEEGVGVGVGPSPPPPRNLTPPSLHVYLSLPDFVSFLPFSTLQPFCDFLLDPSLYTSISPLLSPRQDPDPRRTVESRGTRGYQCIS